MGNQSLFVCQKRKGEKMKWKYNSMYEIIELLHVLDYKCHKQKIVAELVVLGGSGILLFMELHDQKFRPTMDVDINLLSTNDIQKLRSLLEDLDIDIVGGVMEFPPMEDFKKGSMFKLDVDFTSIDVYVPDIELLACSKIFSAREKDLVDLEKTMILENCNKEKLLDMVGEYKMYLLNPDNFNLNLHSLTRIFNEKGI